MAHQEPTGKKKGLSEDVKQQAIHEIVPKLAGFVAKMTPAGLKESDIWRYAQPFISVAIGQFTPDGGVWEDMDAVRVEFFSEYRAALKKEGVVHEAEGAVAVHPSTQFVRGILALPQEDVARTMEWLAELYAEDAVLATKAVAYLDGLGAREIASFAGLEHDGKTAYVTARIGRTENHLERLYQSRLWRPVRYATAFFRRTLPRYARQALGWTREHLTARWNGAIRLAKVASLGFLGLLIAGAVIANAGAEALGRGTILVAGLGSAVVYLLLLLRSADVLAVAAVTTAAVDAAKEKNTSAALDGVLRTAASILAWVIFTAVFCATVPVWRSLVAFFGILTVGSFVAISGYAWRRPPEPARRLALVFVLVAAGWLVVFTQPSAYARSERVWTALTAWPDAGLARLEEAAAKRKLATERATSLATASAEAAKTDAETEVMKYREALKTRSLFIVKGLDKLSPEENKEYAANEAFIMKIEAGMYGRPSTSAPKTAEPAPKAAAASPATSATKKPVAHPPASAPPPPVVEEKREALTAEEREFLEYLEKTYPDL